MKERVILLATRTLSAYTGSAWLWNVDKKDVPNNKSFLIRFDLQDLLASPVVAEVVYFKANGSCVDQKWRADCGLALALYYFGSNKECCDIFLENLSAELLWQLLASDCVSFKFIQKHSSVSLAEELQKKLLDFIETFQDADSLIQRLNATALVFLENVTLGVQAALCKKLKLTQDGLSESFHDDVEESWTYVTFSDAEDNAGDTGRSANGVESADGLEVTQNLAGNMAVTRV